MPPNVVLYVGDALEVLQRFPDRFFQTCVTSPPYWGLRDYGSATWVGGDAECEHRVGKNHEQWRQRERRTKTDNLHPMVGPVCRHCGAQRVDRQLGLEETPAEYIAALMPYLREVRRVLRRDGTLWLNIADTYSSPHCGCPPPDHSGDRALGTRGVQGQSKARATRRGQGGLKRKNLALIPERLLLALQEDGWYIRARIIWHKPNPMPETVRDRPTRDYEFIYLLARNRTYYYDAAALAEPAQTKSRRYVPAGWDTGAGNHHGRRGRYQATEEAVARNAAIEPGATRNGRSVWSIAPQAYTGDHFATFPEELPRRCILATSRPGDWVLDPFVGTGTTAKVGFDLGRAVVGIELLPKTIDQARQRIGPALCTDGDRIPPGRDGAMARTASTDGREAASTVTPLRSERGYCDRCKSGECVCWARDPAMGGV